MKKMVFKQENSYISQPKTTVTYETDAECLTEILEDFRDFLRGCGYSVKGDLVISEEE